jgi:hypothetical protein
MKQNGLVECDFDIGNISTRGVFLPFTTKGILRQKKNYGNSNISPCKTIIFKKILYKKPKPFKIHNSIANIKFQHTPKYHFSNVLI